MLAGKKPSWSHSIETICDLSSTMNSYERPTSAANIHTAFEECAAPNPLIAFCIGASAWELFCLEVNHILKVLPPRTGGLYRVHWNRNPLLPFSIYRRHHWAIGRTVSSTSMTMASINLFQVGYRTDCVI